MQNSNTIFRKNSDEKSDEVLGSKRTRPIIAVVILDWNKAKLTMQCLVLARTMTALNPHWIIVDNGSSPPLTGLPEDVILIRQERNLGFAGGVNIGIHRALDMGADYIWLLNNDAQPLPGTLDILIQAVESDSNIGLASPIILNSDDDDAVDWHGSVLRDGVYASTKVAAVYAEWLQESPNQICLTGTALLLSRRLIKTVGDFDERLFAYWEDTDISLRAGNAGLLAVVVPAAAVRHACGTDSLDVKTRPPYYYYLMSRNEILVLRKARVSWRAMYWTLRRAIRWGLKPGLNLRQRYAVARGVFDGLLGRSGPSPV